MITELLNYRRDILFHYSPYSFLPNIDKAKVFDHSIVSEVNKYVDETDFFKINIEVNGHMHIFFLKYLQWDTEYFKKQTYKLMYILYAHDNYKLLKTACKEFVKKFFTKQDVYCFSELPSEDIQSIQALNEAGFKLVENRLTYYLNLKNYEYQRFKVREAVIDDIPNLKRVAREMRNVYDRFHAETGFDVMIADEFLATYVEESVKGYADYVILPAENGIPADAFVTSNYLIKEWDKIGSKISKMVLSAVSSETCRGWYIKLISETAHHLKSIGAEYAFMHPATTNRAVIHTYEKLGCKYGKCVHVLTFTS